MTTQDTCPDCGVAVGQPHINECDIERCSVCGSQRIICDCEGHDPASSEWTGKWSTNKDAQQPDSASSEGLKTLFPIYDRGDEPLVTVEQLKRDVEEVIGCGDDLPYLAFVSGPEMNLRVEFNDYDGDTDRGIVPIGLIELIRRGADQVLVIAEVWLRGEESTACHGVMILKARPDGDTMHVAEFEGKTTLGPWEERLPVDSGNLSRLFERAEKRSA